jgi:hypothetical protein
MNSFKLFLSAAKPPYLNLILLKFARIAPLFLVRQPGTNFSFIRTKSGDFSPEN